MTKSYGPLLSVLLWLGLGTTIAHAQVTPDSTLSTTITSTDNLNFTIENGDTVGNNLFHSFDEFSIPTTGSARFNNAIDIDAIFSRVTGDRISNIDGLIQANGSADLFLLNPNGIMVGPNAQFDIGGSFIGSTAERIIFQDNVEFSATDTSPSPLLTISTPIGLQMGNTPSTITVQGQGHSTRKLVPTGSPFDRSTSTRGLEVSNGQSIGLLGGDIRFESGVLTAEGGHIEIGAVEQRQGAIIDLNAIPTGWQFGYDNITNFGDIQLLERSLLDASGVGSGSIHIHGDHIDLLNASTALIQNTGSQVAGDLQVIGTGPITLNGNSLEGLGISSLRSENMGSGQGSNILVEAPQLTLQDGAVVSTLGFSGVTGSITIRATEGVDISGFTTSRSTLQPLLVFATALATVNYDQSVDHPGGILVDTKHLRIHDGGSLSSSSIGGQQGGDITINATERIDVSAVGGSGQAPSSLGVFSLIGSGNAGDLMIKTQQVIVSNGGRIASSALDSGTAGDITINASESVEVDGQFSTGAITLLSEISAGANLVTPEIRQALGLPPVPTGTSGTVTIHTPSLHVLNSAAVSVINEGSSGNAGNLQVNADAIVLDRQGSLLATALNGQGGDIFISAQTLEIANSGQINASTQTSQGGDVHLHVGETLQLHNQGRILVDAQQAGQGGNISIIAPQTVLTQDSSISTNVQGTAAGGELNFTGDRLTLLDGSRLSAVTSGSGHAGNLSVQVGAIDISGIEAVEIGGELTPTPSVIAAGTLLGSSGDGGSLKIISDRIRIRDGGLIAVGTLGLGASGDVDIIASEFLEVAGIGDSPAPLFGYQTNHPSRISASSFTDAAAGSVQIQTPLLVAHDGAVVEVNGIGIGGAGNLRVDSDRIFLTDNASLQAEVAGGDQGNISLTASEVLILQQDSQINTNAAGTASGGNIIITTPFLIGMENSDIVANAVQGNGGNINIAAQSLFGLEFRDRLTPDSDITASSQFGVNGTVEINAFNTAPDSGLVELPSGLVDSSNQIAEGCASSQGNTFMSTGRGGIAASPTALTDGNRPWTDTRDLSVFLGNGDGNRSPIPVVVPPSQDTTVTEATTWHTNADGHLELVSLHASQPNLVAHATCTTST